MDEIQPMEYEARAELLDMARGRTGAVPPEVLVDQVLAATAGGGWPVQREGMQAVLRRCAFAKRDGLQVAARPRGDRPLGIYRTAPKGSSVRPYRTLIAGVRPIDASCDCADFLRSSLGLCKHALAALSDLYARARSLHRAVETQESGGFFSRPAVLWDPIRPLTGRGDWLERIALHPGRRGDAGENGVPAVASRLFAGSAGRVRTLRRSHADDPASRLRLVESLLEIIGLGRGAARAALATVPSVPALLQAERDRLRHVTENGLTSRQIERAIATMKQKPYAYQREGVRRFLGEGRLLLADDMGLGKTAQAITACHVLWQARRARRGLLIVPASLKAQWLREWRSFSEAPIEVVDGSPRERRATYRRVRHGYLLINYEQLLRDFDHIAAWKPEIVVLDEAQRIKNWETKSAAYVKSLRPRYRLVLTGTPMENRIGTSWLRSTIGSTASPWSRNGDSLPGT